MKKGFTMIELIFVIVILGILASVAIPRLASTRTDAEISAAVANLRTLESDISAYYVTNGEFATSWEAMSNVKIYLGGPLDKGTLIGFLKVGNDESCITVGTFPENQVTTKAADGTTTTNYQPAYFTVQLSEKTTDELCQEVKNADVVKKFASQELFDHNGKSLGYGIAIGSSTKVY